MESEIYNKIEDKLIELLEKQDNLKKTKIILKILSKNEKSKIKMYKERTKIIFGWILLISGLFIIFLNAVFLKEYPYSIGVTLILLGLSCVNIKRWYIKIIQKTISCIKDFSRKRN